MTYRDIYNDLKDGYSFTDGYHSISIGVCNRYESPSYGKEYIYWTYYGSSAETVSYKNLCWIMSNIFNMRANDFYKKFRKE